MLLGAIIGFFISYYFIYKNETDIRGVVYVIEVQHIDHSFKIGRKGRESEVPVLKDVSLTVEKGNCLYRRAERFRKINASEFNFRIHSADEVYRH